MDQGLIHSIAGEEFRFLPERAVFWPRHRALIVADLHWGKAETFRQHGIALPDGNFDQDLHRLSRLVLDWKAEEILVLGDLFHSRWAFQPEFEKKVSMWRREHGLAFRLIRGNHDRWIPALPEDWNIEILPQLHRGDFSFFHEAPKTHPTFTWSGHVHPMVKIRAAYDQLRLPCFVIGKSSALLPAFGSFTGGFAIRPRQDQTILAILENKIHNLSLP